MRSASRPSYPGQPVSTNSDWPEGLMIRVACPPSTSMKYICSDLLLATAEAPQGRTATSTQRHAEIRICRIGWLPIKSMFADDYATCGGNANVRPGKVGELEILFRTCGVRAIFVVKWREVANVKLTEDPHRRLNALTNEWVLVSPHRTMRPWQGEVGSLPGASEPAYDPNCYLCPGNARAGGVRNPAYTSTFVFDNDFAALKPNTAQDRLDIEGMGLLVAESEPGTCRVICFSPRHDLTLATMGVDAIELVVKTWIEQFRELGNLENIGHVQIFENRGAMMGASNPHPHCQIWATA